MAHMTSSTLHTMSSSTLTELTAVGVLCVPHRSKICVSVSRNKEGQRVLTGLCSELTAEVSWKVLGFSSTAGDGFRSWLGPSIS